MKKKISAKKHKITKEELIDLFIGFCALFFMILLLFLVAILYKIVVIW
jgi:hypothetical protein